VSNRSVHYYHPMQHHIQKFTRKWVSGIIWHGRRILAASSVAHVGSSGSGSAAPPLLLNGPSCRRCSSASSSASDNPAAIKFLARALTKIVNWLSSPSSHLGLAPLPTSSRVLIKLILPKPSECAIGKQPSHAHFTGTLASICRYLGSHNNR
jgi:hypothetical protein